MSPEVFDATKYTGRELRQVAEAFKRIGVLPDGMHYQLGWMRPEIGERLLTTILLWSDDKQEPDIWMRDHRARFIPVKPEPVVYGEYGRTYYSAGLLH